MLGRFVHRCICTQYIVPIYNYNHVFCTECTKNSKYIMHNRLLSSCMYIMPSVSSPKWKIYCNACKIIQDICIISLGPDCRCWTFISLEGLKHHSCFISLFLLILSNLNRNRFSLILWCVFSDVRTCITWPALSTITVIPLHRRKWQKKKVNSLGKRRKRINLFNHWN